MQFNLCSFNLFIIIMMVSLSLSNIRSFGVSFQVTGFLTFMHILLKFSF